MVVFALKLALEPAGKLAQRLGHDFLGILGSRLPAWAVAGADQDGEDILTLCAICARVAWPIGAPTCEREWIEPVEYYRRGGVDIALISHGFCKDCFNSLQEDPLRLKKTSARAPHTAERPASPTSFDGKGRVLRSY